MREEYKINYVVGEKEQEGIIYAYENEDDVEIRLKIKDIFIAKHGD